MSSRKMPGRRSVSLEPEELSSTASPIRRSSRNKAVHVDSPVPKTEIEKPEPVAARRTRRAQSNQEKSLNEIENDLKERDESSLFLKNKLLENKSARRVKRSSSLQDEINDGSDSRPVRRTRRLIISSKDVPSPVEEEKENDEENSPEVRGRPKRRVTRSVSKSSVDTTTTKPISAPASKKYRLLLNKDLQVSGKASALNIIDENEDELNKDEKSKEKTPKKSSDAKNNNYNKVATVVLEKLDTSAIEKNNKTDPNEKKEEKVLKSSDEIDKVYVNREKKIKKLVLEIKQEDSENELEIIVDETVKEEKHKSEDEIVELHLFLEVNEEINKTADQIEDPETTKDLNQSEENNDFIESEIDTNISLVCEKETIENPIDVEEDDTNISIVGSTDSSPKNISSTPAKSKEESPKKIEQELNLSLVNNDGKSYSPIIGVIENITVDLEEDSIVDSSYSIENSSSLHEKSLKNNTKILESPAQSTKETYKSNNFDEKLINEDSFEIPISPILSKPSRIISNYEKFPEIFLLNVSKKSIEKTSPKKSKRSTENEEQNEQLSEAESSKLEEITTQSPKLDVIKKSTEESPIRKSRRLTEKEELTEELYEAESSKLEEKTTESPELDNSIKSHETPTFIKSERLTEKEEINKDLSETESLKLEIETFEPPKLDISTKSTEKTLKRKSKRFTEGVEENKRFSEAYESSKLEVETFESPKLDVTKKSTEKTPRRKSERFAEENKELSETESSALTLQSPKMDISNTKNTPKRKSRNADEEKESIQEEIKIPKDSTEKIKSAENSTNSEQKGADIKMDKLLDNYLMTYSEKKRKRDLDESISSAISFPEKKKKRRSIVSEINFSDSESYDSDNENRHEFLDDMAFEGSKDTSSVDSNETIDESESIYSPSTETDSDSDYEENSFVVDDDVGNELLSGNDDDHIDAPREKGKRRRIFTISDSSDEDLRDMSMKEGIRNPEDESVIILNDSIAVENTRKLVKEEEILEKDAQVLEDKETPPTIEEMTDQDVLEQDEQEVENFETTFSISEPEEEDTIEENLIVSETTETIEITEIIELEETSQKKQILQEIDRGLDETEQVSEEKGEEIYKPESDEILIQVNQTTDEKVELVEINRNLEEIDQESININKEEQEIQDPDREEILIPDSSTTEENDEKYQVLFSKYFNQFDEGSSKRRNRRATLDYSPKIEENISNKRKRGTSLGSQIIVEESKQRFVDYCEKLKEKQERKRKLSERKENIVEAQEKKEIIKSPQKSKRKSKGKCSISYEINTSGVILVSPRKVEDVTSKSNKLKSEVSNEASEILKDFNNSLKKEIDEFEKDQDKIELESIIIENKITQISKKKYNKKKKLDTSVHQFEDLAEVNIFKTPKSDKVLSVTQQIKKIKLDTSVEPETNLSPVKKQKKLKKIEQQFEDLAEVNIFKTPVVEERVKSPVKKDKSLKKKKNLTESVEKQKSFVENVEEKKKKKIENVENKRETLKTDKGKKIRNKSSSENLELNKQSSAQSETSTENKFTFKKENYPSTSMSDNKLQHKGAVSKFKIKKEKSLLSKNEYMHSSKYSPNKSNKYKNLIKPSTSGWTDPTVTVKNLCQYSHGIRKKKPIKMFKAGLCGNIIKFDVERLLSEDLVKSVKSKNLHKKK